jgi:DNA polymerase-3 subunit delta
MKIVPGRIADQLARAMPPAVLLAGEEMLLVLEARQAVIQAARDAGFDETVRLEVERGFDWSRLAAEAMGQSLFASRRLIDLRLPTGKPGTEGGKALKQFIEQQHRDTVLLLSPGKWERASSKTAWYRAFDKDALVVEIAPVRPAQLPAWIEQRARSMGMAPTRDAVLALTRRTEGNLLAAAQELRKLHVLFGETGIGIEQVEEAAADSARFDVFGLVDAVMLGQGERVIRVLDSLKAEGEPPVRVIWALSREIRLCARVAGEPRSQHAELFKREAVWPSRQKLIQQAAQRRLAEDWRQLLAGCARADAAAKGQVAGDPWLMIETIAADAASKAALFVPSQWGGQLA